jgi:general secretion pathway protein D
MIKTIGITYATKRFGSAALLRLAASTLLFTACATQLVLAQNQVSDQAGLNFVGADIESVIKAMGQYTNTTFIIDPRVKGTINLVTERPVTKEQALRLLTSTLRVQGYAVVPGDGFSKVVPEADAKLQAAASQSSVRGDQIATQIFRLNYESAANLVPVLRPLISPNNTINANIGNNTLVVTDYGDNLRRIAKIVAALDAPASSELEVIPIRYAMAVDIATMVNRLLEPVAANAPAGTAGAEMGRVSVLADPRTNSVIVRAPSLARSNLAKSLIAKLDQPTALPGNVHVVPLKNAEAVKLAQTLRAVVISDNPNASAQGNTDNQPQRLPQQTQQQQQQQQQYGNASAAPGSQQDNSSIMNSSPLNSGPQAQSQLPAGGPGGYIQADASTNSLIITASEPVYRNLRTVIDQLDVRRAQVFVETLIVEVTSDKAAEFGVQWAGASGDANSSYRIGGITGFTAPGGGNNLISQATNQANGAALIAPGNGLTLGIFRQTAGKLGLGFIAHALQSDADTNILSMPNLITLDNEEARIIVGQNVPFITGQYTTQASGGTTGVNPFQTIERHDVGLSLRVRPQVSEGGTVRMAIYQETSSIQPTTNASDIITNKRSIETNVLVNDGEIIVLGGLLEDTVNDSQEKVPVLGDIPVVGNLFKYRSRSRAKTNLMVFLRPTVIRTNEQSVNVAGNRYDLMRNIEINATPAPSAILPDTGAPVMPPLQDGRPQGGSLLPSPNTPNTPSTGQ